jgi:serine/threonine protein kinase
MSVLLSQRDASGDERQRLHAIVQRVKDDWQKFEFLNLAEYLPAPNDPLRALALCECIKIDLEMQWSKHRCMLVEDYLQAFPELRILRGAIVELLVKEFRMRHEHGDRPKLASYQARFPALFDELQVLIHRTVFATKLPPLTPDTVDDKEDLPPPLPPLVESPENNKGPQQSPPPDKPEQAPQDNDKGAIGEGYRVLERIGGGMFGVVYKGAAPGGVDVAIKVVYLTAEGARELGSLDLVKRLRHPFLLQTQAYWRQDDQLYIVMELADENLRDRLDQCKEQNTGIPLAELLQYTQEACEALDFLHARQVLHRDIKPDNILLLAGHAKVADFGLARLRDQQRSFQQATSVGTPMYMAPEVWRGHVTAQSDQYSLASTYAELRRNRPLFAAFNYMNLMLAHDHEVPDLADLPPNEQAVLLKALAKEPRDRYATCKEFGQALAEAVARDGAESRLQRSKSQESISTAEVAAEAAEDRGTVEPPTPSRWLLILGRVALAVCIMLLALGGGWWIIFSPHKSPQKSDVFLPNDCQADSRAELIPVGGRKLYQRILLTRGAKEIPFVLIGPEKERPVPFYMMETKVSNELFGLFADESQQNKAAAGDAWRKGAMGPKGRLGFIPLLPVVYVSNGQARAFAHWLGGELPSAEQWDEGGGRFVKLSDKVEGQGARFSGPFYDKDLVDDKPDKPKPRGLDCLQPIPITQSILKSYYGCYDMAGNVMEWTRTRLSADPTRIVQRGTYCYDKDPYRFDHEGASRKEDDGGDERTGFRVVLELPEAGFLTR